MPEEEAKPTVATIATSGKMFAMLDAASVPCAEEVVPTMDAANAPARTSFFIMDLHFKYFDVISVETALKGHDALLPITRCYQKSRPMKIFSIG